MTEAQIQKQSAEYLRACGCLVYRLNSGVVKGASGRYVRLCPAGTPDLLVVDRLGQTWWIEIKRGDGALNDAQVDMHRLLEARGQRVLVIRDPGELMRMEF